MSDDFIPPVPVIENAMPEDLGIACTPDETAVRLSLCQTCVNFTFKDGHTVCSSSGCNISLMTTFSFKQCPLEKW